jgi:hypothetical protein
MHNEFTAVVERDGPWYVAYCAEVLGGNGQGRTRQECIANAEAVPRHAEIANLLAKRICRKLAVPDPPG